MVFRKFFAPSYGSKDLRLGNREYREREYERLGDFRYHLLTEEGGIEPENE